MASNHLAYKVISCSSENVSHPVSNVYKSDSSFWESGGPVTKVELLIGLSSPSFIRTIKLENNCAALIEVLGGNSGDELENYEVLLPVHSLRTIQNIKNGEKEHETEQIRCKLEVAKKKYNRLRVILRVFSASVFGLRSLQFFSSRIASRESTEPVVPKETKKEKEEEKEVIKEKKEKSRSPSPSPPPKKPSKEKPVEKPSVTKSKSSKPLKGVTIVISGIGNPERGDIRSKACKLGAEYSANWDRKSTHLICSVFNQQKCLQAKKAKKPIVKPDWVFDCYKKKELLDVDKYILEEKTRSSKRNSKSTRSRRSRSPINYKEDSDSISEEDSLSEPSEDGEWNSELEEEPPKSSKKKTSIISDEDDWGIDVGKPKSKEKTKITKSKKKEPSDDELEFDDIEEFESDPMEEVEEKKIAPSKVKVKQKEKEKDVSMEEPSDSEATEEMDKEEIKKAMEGDADTSMDDLDSTSADCTAPGKHGPLNKLPNFMENIKCYIYVSDPKLKHELRRYIIAYGGNVDDFLYTDTHYLITDKEWEASFNTAQDQMQSLRIVKPSWVTDCHKNQAVVDSYDHLVPDD